MLTSGTPLWTLEATGVIGAVGSAATSISGNRVGYTSAKIAELEATVSCLKTLRMYANNV